ncbi:sugar transferase [Candidatus Parcubacteria bacterium]|nr:MAG: sugar transferase [Candidatus Parcubacteria bacterium]
MPRHPKFVAVFLAASDAVVLYASLFITLYIRYGGGFYDHFKDSHAVPFSIVFGMWIAVFYVAGLYDIRRLRNSIDFLKTLSLAIFVNALLTIAFFYLIPVFGISPRRNLFLFIAVFAVLAMWWRRLSNNLIVHGEAPNKVLLIGNGPTAEAVVKAAKEAPQLGYEIKTWMRDESVNSSASLKTLALERGINLVVIPRHLKKNADFTKALYELLGMGVEARDLPNFYELVFRKVPLADLEEAWFLENLIGHQKFYDQLKRASEFAVALLLAILLLPLEILIALAIKLTSPGPAIYSQVRAGQNGKPFILYKFRTMDAKAEKDGPKWADPNDIRATAFGQFLRYTHLDELPQLINIIRGELSFVGPRPERPEFVELLGKEIPYYNIRHLIKPGVTGWAQINYRYGASVEDAYEKLQYDIYYLKNRSILLDLATLLKTFKSFFINQQ